MFWKILAVLTLTYLFFNGIIYYHKTNIEDERIERCMMYNISKIHSDKSYDLMYSWCKNNTDSF